MPSLFYKRQVQLNDAYRDTIAALAFSEDGTHLASASLEGRLCIWSVSASEARFVICGDVGFLSVVWINEQTLLAGMQDGLLMYVNFTGANLLRATGWEAHIHPVERLGLCDTKLASGAHSQVFIWRVDTSGKQCTQRRELDSPPKAGASWELPVIVTGLHWAPSINPNALIVSYKDHNTMDSQWGVQGNVPCILLYVSRSQTASLRYSSLSPDHALLVVPNLTTGFEIWDTGLNTPVRKLIHEDTESRLFRPVNFIHRGHAVVGGIAPGWAGIWDLKTERFIHGLEHPGQSF
ncbi:WD40 repeat-like protein [Pluteus cervinus]|uniref:WD40 repeat-like protein n=1 Tax=Pluteus cervinus TaxID=181527 RepID=A0ACD3A9M3_9AGAR|nr:WD40 repeat-like protein [Pluteus cervinus]